MRLEFTSGMQVHKVQLLIQLARRRATENANGNGLAMKVVYVFLSVAIALCTCFGQLMGFGMDTSVTWA